MSPVWVAAAAYAGFAAVVAWGAGLAYAAEWVVRRRRGLEPAGVGAAFARGFAGVLLAPAVTLWALAAMVQVWPAGRFQPMWVRVAVLFTSAYPPAAAAVFASLTGLRAAAPRRDVLIAAGIAAFVWLAGLWAAVAAVDFLI